MAAQKITNAEKGGTEETCDPLILIRRQTSEIVVALVGPVGSGISTSAALLKNLLEENYSYRAQDIRVSELIKAFATLVGEQIQPGVTGEQRIEKLQSVGTQFREKYGDDYLAQKCVEQIAASRELSGGYDESERQWVIKPRRCVHIQRAARFGPGRQSAPPRERPSLKRMRVSGSSMDSPPVRHLSPYGKPRSAAAR